MRVKYRYSSRPVTSIAKAVESELITTDMGQGCAESALSIARNNAEAIGVLIETLHNNGALTNTEIEMFLGYKGELIDE